MPRAFVERELLASTGDVWAFLSEPYHFSDWWPGVAAVQPDRRGAAAGARWRVQRARPGWTQRRDGDDTLLVLAAEERRLFVFELVRARIKGELRLAPLSEDRTRARLSVELAWFGGSPSRLAGDALTRLHALCQTGAA